MPAMGFEDINVWIRVDLIDWHGEAKSEDHAKSRKEPAL
jgi:hypothetical protein